MCRSPFAAEILGDYVPPHWYWASMDAVDSSISEGFWVEEL